jgi:hypothetical protein
MGPGDVVMTNVASGPRSGLANAFGMTVASISSDLAGRTSGNAVVQSDAGLIRALVIFVGISWSVLFVLLGLRYDLHLYADGSIFSYSVAVEDGWAFHWHNISGRLSVYVFSHLPAELFVAFTGNAGGGLAIYGFLFFVAQLAGILATYAVDGSKGRVIFSYACLSTACLCPLVFGFPTEMWMAHALFWPTLAACHYVPRKPASAALVFLLLLALTFSHDGALIFAVVILATLLLRKRHDGRFTMATAAFGIVIAIWIAVKVAFPPDPTVAGALRRAALHFFDIGILGDHVILLLFGALASFVLAERMFQHVTPTTSHLYAGLLVATALAAYWLWFDHALLAQDRYYLRTILLVGTTALGLTASASAIHADGESNLPRLFAKISGNAAVARTAAVGILLVTLVHAVETAKFVVAWTHYKSAVARLAMGAVSDSALGHRRFVSADRISAELSRLSWFSTTHFLSVLVAPAFAPARLVVDPRSNYFWLSCETATANEHADRAIPVKSRKLVRLYACLRR